MIYKLKALTFITLGIAIMIGAIVGEVLWLGFCFGTVIVGIVLLFTLPLTLVWPALTGVPAGFIVFGKGLRMWYEGPADVPQRSTPDSETYFLDEAAMERQIRANQLAKKLLSEEKDSAKGS